MRILLLLAALASGCAAPGVETQASRDQLNCVYAAQYLGDYPAWVRQQKVEACKR